MCALYDNKMHAHYDKRHEVSSAWQHAYALGAREFPRAIQSQRSTQWKKYLSAHEPSREIGSDFSSSRLPTGLLVFDFHVAQSVSVNTTQDMAGGTKLTPKVFQDFHSMSEYHVHSASISILTI